MKEVGTLKELDVKPGDVVEYIYGKNQYTIAKDKCLVFPDGKNLKYRQWDTCSNFRIISRASEKPKLWRDMTPEEKGALLLAAHEGRELEYWRRGSGGWASCSSAGIYDNESYRIRTEPKVETVTIYGSPSKHVQWCLEQCGLDTHRITFNTIDGKPDCSSVRMEKL